MLKEEQSYEKSFEYHQKSEKDIYSLQQLGFMKTIGSGCKFDFEQVDSFYISNKEKLNVISKYSFGKFYTSHGYFERATEIYENIADVYPEASFQLGMMYKNGVLNKKFEPD